MTKNKNITTTYNLIIYSLMFGSIVSWSIAIMKSSPNMGDFGLVNSLSFFYFISLAMLLCSFLLTLIKKDKGGATYFAIILLLIIFVFLTPAIIEGTPRFRYSYKAYGYTDYINRNGNIDPLVIWYHNWPGTFLFTSMLSNIIDKTNDHLFLTYFPFIIELIYLFPLYIFLSSLFQDEKKVWLGVWIFYILNFINQDYMSPQAFAYLFYLIFLSIVVKVANIGKNYDINENISYKLVCIILFSGLVITHMMTPLMVLSILIFSVLLLSGSKTFLYKLIFMCILVMVGWTIYGAYNYLHSYLLDFIQKSYKMDLIFEQNLEKRVAGSPAHLIVSKLMIFTTLISIIFAAIGIFTSYYGKDKKISSINLQTFAMIGAVLVSAPSTPYGGELIMRLFLFMIPFISFFIPQIFARSNMKIFIILFLVVMTPLHIFTHYGNEKYDFITNAEIVSYDFFYDKFDNGNITGGFPSYAYKYPERYDYSDFENMKWNGKEYTMNTKKRYDIMISRGDKEQFEIFNNNVSFINDIEDNIMKSNNYVSVYSNGDMNMYNNVNYKILNVGNNASFINNVENNIMKGNNVPFINNVKNNITKSNNYT